MNSAFDAESCRSRRRTNPRSPPCPGNRRQRFPEWRQILRWAKRRLSSIVLSRASRYGNPGPVREWVGLGAVILLAAGLRLWRLDQNGFGNSYYAAAVRSMLVNGTNFFFGAFDHVGLVTVDKPPVAIWLQALSAKVLTAFAVSFI